MCGIVFKDFNFTSYKFLSLSILFFGLASAVSLFEPFDLGLQSLSNKIRQKDASGEIVVISLDAYAEERGFSTPIPADEAEIILRIMVNAGADKIVLTEPVVAGKQDDITALKKIIDEHADKIFIAYPDTDQDSVILTGQQKYINTPIPIHNEKTTRFWGGVDTIEYARRINGRSVISAESALTKVYGEPGEEFFIDYSYDVKSLPEFDFIQILNGQQIQGKKLILGYETTPNGITVPILGLKGSFGFPTITALGAETLMSGRPSHLSWGWPLLIACAFAYYLLGKKSVPWQLFIIVFFIALCFTTKIALNYINMDMDIATAIVFILFTAPCGINLTNRENSTRKSAEHPDSGLPSLNTLRVKSKTPRPLVVASIAGFDELIGILSPVERKTLAVRICSLATSGNDIWHGEDGHFYWFIRAEQAESLSDHLESLGLILRNGFSIGTFPISLQTVFGVDMRYDASLSDRILGANLSAKRAGMTGKTWLTYEEEDKVEAAWSITRLRELDLAIRAGQIRADLQPKVDLRTGQIAGVEALARWTHPIRGSIRPDEFIAAAEGGRRIKELTIAVMHSALASVQSTIFENAEFTLSVNITPSLLTDITFPHTISALLAEYPISPANLILEITESTAFSNNETCLKSMHELVAMGITLSIDDYGTGNSTLDYLRRIPARELKIDRKFVSDILKSDEDSLLVKSTIKLAHELNMLVVAEGVEDSLTLEKLRIMGCDLVQGFLISRPLSPENFTHFVSTLSRPARKINKKP